MNIELKNKTIELLLSWFQKNQRDFPWRKDPTPYTVWIAEIMSQQTQMNTLIPYFYKFLKKFPNVQILANAHEADVLSAWTGLGYYSRARNLHSSAKIISFENAGKFPSTYSGWLELPGVGPYTAAAIASQCYSIPEPVWDGNVLRIFSRLYANKNARTKPFQEAVQNQLRTKMDSFNPSFLNQACMELGALICTPKKPTCSLCPVQAACQSYKTKTVEQFPPAKIRKSKVELNPNVWIQLFQSSNDYYVLLSQKQKGTWFAGMWDFPSELNHSRPPLKRGQFIGTAQHSITHHKITLNNWVHLCSRKVSMQNGKWIQLSDLTSDEPSVPLSTTARKTIKLLMKWINSCASF